MRTKVLLLEIGSHAFMNRCPKEVVREGGGQHKNFFSPYSDFLFLARLSTGAELARLKLRYT